MYSKIKNTFLKISTSAFVMLAAGDTSPFRADLDQKQGDMVGDFIEASGYRGGELVLSNMTRRLLLGFMSMLGLIFIILIVYGGYQWLTARGNEQQATKAKDTITHAIWGIVITLSAYAIAYFIMNFIMTGGQDAA